MNPLAQFIRPVLMVLVAVLVGGVMASAAEKKVTR